MPQKKGASMYLVNLYKLPLGSLYTSKSQQPWYISLGLKKRGFSDSEALEKELNYHIFSSEEHLKNRGNWGGKISSNDSLVKDILSDDVSPNGISSMKISDRSIDGTFLQFYVEKYSFTSLAKINSEVVSSVSQK